MGKTNIQYADWVSNPLFVIDKVSGKHGTHCEMPDPDGSCAKCWAQVLNRRGKPDNKRFGTGLAYDKENRDRVEWFRHEKEMNRLANLNRRKPMSEKFPGNPLVVFTNDTYDLFQPSISDELRDWVFDHYDTFTDLTLLIQTTYVSLMRKYLTARYPDGMPPHYIIGMSAGTNKFLGDKYRHFIAINAHRRYVIFEPLLEHIDATFEIGAYEPGNNSPLRRHWLGFISWIIIGGESGTDARPCNVEWIRMLSKHAKRFGVSLLVKQLGTKAYDSRDLWFTPGSIVVPVDGPWRPRKLKGHKGDHLDDFSPELQIREFPKLKEGKS